MGSWNRMIIPSLTIAMCSASASADEEAHVWGRSIGPCEMDRAAVSPSGEHLLFFPDGTTQPRLRSTFKEAVVLEVDCLLADADWRSCPNRTFSRGVGAYIVSAGWTAEGGVFIWDGQGGSLAPSFDEPEEPFPESLASDVAKPAVFLQGAPSRDQVAAAVTSIEGIAGSLSALVVPREGPFLLAASDPREGGFVSYRLSTERRFNPSTVHDQAPRRFVIGDSEITPTGGYLMGGTAIITPGMEEESALPPFSSPIVDSMTGAVAGVATAPDRISLPGLDTVEKLLSQHIANDTSDGGRTVLRAVDIHAEAGIAVVSYVRDLSARTFRVVRWKDDVESSVLRCGSSEVSAPGFIPPPLEDVRSRFLTGGSPQWPIAAVLLQHGDAERRLAVYLHGGPGGTTFRNELYWRRHLEAGLDVLSTAVSGGVDMGSGALDRLAADPVAAFERDAAMLAALIDDELGEIYDDVVIHSESLSAGLALELAERLSPRRVRVVLVSPWLGYRPLEERGLNMFGRPIDPRSQERYEAVALGFTSQERRERYFEWIDALTERAQPANVLIVAGAIDDRIDLAKLERLGAEGRAQVAILDQWGHETVMTAPPAWELILEFIAEP